jgi:uncharacterized surface protein with fasciclin (FAS1) repeats
MKLTMNFLPIMVSTMFFSSAMGGQFIKHENKGADQYTIADVVSNSPEHTTLEALLTQAGLLETLDDESATLTLFGPTDEAFSALGGAADKFLTPEFSEHLVDILKYHLVAGAVMSTDLALGEVKALNDGTAEITSLTSPMINTANIVNPFDVEAINGVVHSTDGVLLPASVTSDIVDIASSADDFSILVSLVVAADLVDVLKSEGPFTVFAPTNAAFAALPEETVDFLTSPKGKDTLVNILTYHVTPGNLYSSEIHDGDITMVNQDEAELDKDGDEYIINEAEVISPQILASNGVIYAINEVLIPPN